MIIKTHAVVSAPPRRLGFSLIEMLIVLAALQVFLALVAGTMWAMVRIERRAAADLQQLLTQGALADRFRADVAGAATAPKKLNGVVVGPQCLILRSAEGKKVIYRWEAERLERSEISAAGTTRQQLPLGVEQGSVEFTRTDAGRLLTLRLTETRGQGSTRHSIVVEITAALGAISDETNLSTNAALGVALLAVVIALALVSVVLGATTWQILAQRRTLERRQNQAQAMWLARAGVERAAARLLAGPAGYTGETVELLPGSQLHIAVKRAPGPAEVFEVTSEARYPADAPNAVVRALTRRFRRVVDGDRTHLTMVPPEASKEAPP